MSLPVVAIVGRPNVGKSSLFNSLLGKRTSIVEPTPGVTRDRVSAVCEIENGYIELVDTGGFGIVDRDDLTEHVRRQIGYAVDQADLILFVVDAREGLSPLDRETAELLRRRADRVRLIANKVDEPHMSAGVGEFIKLGYGEPVAISALNGGGKWALIELIVARLADRPKEPPTDPVMKIALIGKRNTGKSSFVNALAGVARVIVSEVPGTTRDSIDVRFEQDGRSFVAIDTAGIRKKSKTEDGVEFFAHGRAMHSVRRADVVLLLIDSTETVGQVEKQLAGMIVEELKPCVLVVNKWDLAKDRAVTGEYGEYLSKLLPHLDYAPISFTSAIDGHNVDATIDVAWSLFKQSQIRVGTGVLNQILRDAMDSNAPHGKRNRKAPKFYYATQVSTQPPTIVVFTNDPHRVTQDYERFLLNRFRERLPFEEIPIRLVFKARSRRALIDGVLQKEAL
jgi:GTP-binding protein